MMSETDPDLMFSIRMNSQAIKDKEIAIARALIH